MRGPRIPPPLWMLAFALGMWGLNRYWPVMAIVPGSWRRWGWLVVALALLPPIAAIVQFRQADTTPNPHRLEAATSLVTSGVYTWTRNPMYLGLLTVLLGWAIRLGTLTPLAGPPLFAALLQRVQIRPEEQTLRKLFGQEYDQYCRRVNRWLGRGEP